jgi:hypothetical protein
VLDGFSTLAHHQACSFISLEALSFLFKLSNSDLQSLNVNVFGSVEMFGSTWSATELSIRAHFFLAI